jgi:branched-chain amino acid transport system ATP-binding protein
MGILLNIKNLSVFYGSVQALKKVSLQVDEGQIVSLVGANGAGKSTLMRTIIGLTEAHEGQIQFESRNILGMQSHRIIQLGLGQSPEGRQVFADMTVLENLQMGAFSVRLTRKQMQDKIEEVFSLFPILNQRKGEYAITLSGGEQQMLAIGRALMVSPKLLLLDEPSLGVSPLVTQKIFDILCDLNKKGTAILLAEQNAAMSLEFAHRGYVLELGEVIFQDTGARLLDNDVIRKAYLGV